MTRTLLVVEDHALVSEGILKVVTTQWPDLVAHQACDLASALRCLDTAGIDVIITDLNLPDAQGLDTLVRLRAHAPRSRIGVVSGSNELSLALACLREGACAFVPKAGSLAHFTEGLRTLAHGGVYFPRELLAQAHAAAITGPDDEALATNTGASVSAAPSGRPGSPARLTPRQIEVRALLLHGLANALIADQLGISEETVKLHVRAILRAHGAHNRVHLLLNCARDGLPEAPASGR